MIAAALKRLVLVGTCLAALILGLPALASGQPAPETVWLCRPGAAGDPCGGGTGAPVDCFYVYPTISAQLGDVADRTVGGEQIGIAGLQASPFDGVCNIWAPIYRQATLKSIFTLSPQDRARSQQVGYSDVLAAWDDYMAHHNNGRGVVLIGHSQGTGMLRVLLRERIEPTADHDRLVSALLIGGNVLVPKGKVVGGDFARTPACTSWGQIGCVIGYSAYGVTPPPDARFGLSPATPLRPGYPAGPDYEVLCTNPAALGSDRSAQLHSLIGGRPVDAYSGRCTTTNGARVLMVEGGGSLPASALPAVPMANWGLHLWDVNVVAGDLIELVRAQSKAFGH
ncbi:DUF3089 domain-containing protein [Aldersonia kunmingensis]|uniref:DUF3089 domain-containing protein n=1 Tax=Aldersonia kunmingensis TaxID=408066 RepID=UPI00082C10D1|nr:DUF3089 domain-containing protein [Aldersonia kunmingensis]